MSSIWSRNQCQGPPQAKDDLKTCGVHCAQVLQCWLREQDPRPEALPISEFAGEVIEQLWECSRLSALSDKDAMKRDPKSWSATGSKTAVESWPSWRGRATVEDVSGHVAENPRGIPELLVSEHLDKRTPAVNLCTLMAPPVGGVNSEGIGSHDSSSTSNLDMAAVQSGGGLSLGSTREAGGETPCTRGTVLVLILR